MNKFLVVGVPQGTDEFDSSLKVKKLKYMYEGKWTSITIRSNLRENEKRTGAILFNSVLQFLNGCNYIAIPPLSIFRDLLLYINDINETLWSKGVKAQVRISAHPNGFQGRGMLSTNFFTQECEECQATRTITPVLIDPKTNKLKEGNDGYFITILEKWREVRDDLPLIINYFNQPEVVAIVKKDMMPYLKCKHLKGSYEK